MPSLREFIGTFDGSTGTRAAERAADALRTGQNNAFAASDPILRNSYAAAKTTLGDSFREAQDLIRSGRQQVHENLNLAGNENRDIINTGFDAAREPLRSAEATISRILEPFSSQGIAANARLSQALGTGPDGAAGAQQFYREFADYDPMRQYRSQQIREQLANQANAGGVANSGRTGLMTAEALNRSYTDDVERHLAHLERGVETGGRFGATQVEQTARILGQQSALEQARTGALSGNLTQHRDLLARLYDPTVLADLEVRRGTAIAPFEEREGIANANNIAGREINLGNIAAGQAAAKNAAIQTGMNNIINLGSKIAAAYMGMPSLGSATAGTQGMTGTFGSELANQPGNYYTPSQLSELSKMYF